MKSFAKLFSISDGHQILYTVDYDSEEEKHSLVVRTEFSGCGISITLSAGSDKKIRQYFDKLTLTDAEKQYFLLKKEMGD